MSWVLEPNLFSDESFGSMREAVVALGHDVVEWDDDWWATGRWPHLDRTTVVFHGSLGNAARIRDTLPWRPGAYCDVHAFHCSSWYPRAHEWLIHREWRVVSLEDLVSDTRTALGPLRDSESVFIRPDSPLKPFSGRALPTSGIHLKSLDFGVYFDDLHLPVVVAPVRSIGREWRYVVADRQVIAGTAYHAAMRAPLPDDPAGAPWRFASLVAERLAPPEAVYVMDLCEADGDLRLLELNPFSGADLYACSRAAVVTAVSDVASTQAGGPR